MAELAASPAYEGIDVRREIAKGRVWLTTKPGRKFTKSFVVNWLNKVEKPLKVASNGATKTQDRYRRVQLPDGRIELIPQF